VGEEVERQIRRDVPRCHPYCPLIACNEGRGQLERVLIAWTASVEDEGQGYWQVREWSLHRFGERCTGCSYVGDGSNVSFFQGDLRRFLPRCSLAMWTVNCGSIDAES
jgi:hypothetical protein